MGASMRRKLIEQPEHVLTSGEWFITVPEESTNLVPNPSFESGTTNWSAVGTGVTITRDTAESYYGSASLRVSDGAATGSNEYAQSSLMAASAGVTYTLSFRYKKRVTGVQTGTFYAGFYTSAPALITSVGKALARGNVSSWQYETFTFVAPATTAFISLIFATHGVTSGAFDLWLDGIQLEAKPYATTYIDGYQEDCVWLGAQNNSASFRPASTRKGGRLQPMKNYKFKVGACVGAGAAALSTLSTPYAQIGGGYYQGSIAPPRVITLVGAFECDSAIDLARRRAELFRAVSPLSTGQAQPARLLYMPQSCGENIAAGVIVDGVYGGGLEGNQTNDYGQERASLTFTTYLPFAALGISSFDVSSALDFTDAVSRNYLIRRSRVTGEWDTTPTDPNDGITAMVTGGDGSIYVGGHFTNIGGCIAKWSPEQGQWTNDFVVGADASVYALARGFGNDIFIGGDFSTFDGGAAVGIVRHNAGTTYTMGSGTNNTVYAIAVGPDGSVYAGGAFTTAGGGAASRVAKWDGSTWSALSTGLNGTVFALAVAPDGTLYAGGTFTGRVAKWNGSAWSVVGSVGISGGTDEVYALAIAPNGTLIVGGAFTTASLTSGSISVNNIVGWNGAGWFPLGVGTDYGVNVLKFAPDGTLYLGGAFGTAGGLPTNGFAEWNGSTFIASDQNGGPVGAIGIDASYVWLGYSLGSTGVSATSGATEITTPVNSADARIRFVGPGRLTSLRNWTNGARMYFNLDMQPSEAVTLSLSSFSGINATLVSDARGDISSLILPSSTPGYTFLSPGENIVTAYIDGSDGNTSANAVWREAYTSIDEGQ